MVASCVSEPVSLARRERALRGRSDDVDPDHEAGRPGRPPIASASPIGVEAAARLLAEMPRRHELDQHLRWREVLAADALMEHLHDVETDVEADEVGQLERAHRMVQADP